MQINLQCNFNTYKILVHVINFRHQINFYSCYLPIFEMNKYHQVKQYS